MRIELVEIKGCMDNESLPRNCFASAKYLRVFMKRQIRTEIQCLCKYMCKYACVSMSVCVLVLIWFHQWQILIRNLSSVFSLLLFSTMFLSFLLPIHLFMLLFNAFLFINLRFQLFHDFCFIFFSLFCLFPLFYLPLPFIHISQKLLKRNFDKLI